MIFITICSISAAGGCGPGIPRVTSPLATFALHWLCTWRISLISFWLIPLANPFGDPHLGPNPYNSIKNKMLGPSISKKKKCHSFIHNDN